jgi:hypothetical protein
MVAAFTKKKIKPSKRVCLRLKETRERSGMTLYQVSQRTKIDEKYLHALEECRFDDLPEAMTYKKHFIKSYLQAIGVDPKPYIHQYVREEHNPNQSVPVHPKQKIQKYHFHNIPSAMKYSVMTGVILLVVGYLGVQVKHMLEPPSLTLFSPKDGAIITEQTVNIQGATEPEAKIFINGKGITSNERGEFSEPIDLAAGINEIEITAERKHGKGAAETLHVIYRETTQLTMGQKQENS